MEDIRLEILKQMDNATTRGIKYVEEYLREHGGIILIEDNGNYRDKMWAIVFDYDVNCNIEIEITGLRLDINAFEPKGELEIRLDRAENEWISIYDDVYVLPTIQSILEAINQYK